MERYERAALYVQTAASFTDKIAKVDQILNGLLDLQIASIDSSNIESYTLNDGQTIISEKYQTQEQVTLAFDKWMLIKQKLIALSDANVVGRTTRLVPVQNARNRNY